MNALRNMLFLAVAAGLLVGVAMTVMQYYFTVPIILAAETYEGAEAPADQGHGSAAEVGASSEQGHATTAEAAAPDDHDPNAWAPADGFSRSAFTFLANVVTAVGFGLLLVAASEFAGGIRTWRQGIFWGLAGFAVFVLAPDLGLSPGLPGVPAAEVGARQTWWIGTALATAAGLALMVYGRSFAFGALGALLLIVPHLIGAPQPPSYESPVPEGLHHQFAVAVTVTNFAFWMLLGGAVATLRPRFAAGLATPSERMA